MRRLRNLLLLISIALSIVSACPIIVKSQGFPPTDILIPPDMNRAELTSFIDPSPGYYETSEYMIGTVAIGIILLESDGSIDISTENWNSDRENEVISRIDDGLDFLVSYNPRRPFSFTIVDVHFRVPTSYEPINRPSTDEGLWIGEAMTHLEYSGSYFTQVRDYTNDLRDFHNKDWAFAIFVVDSNNDADGRFTDNRYAYAYFSGPFFVMTFDVGHIRGADPGVKEMDRVTAHETCHIFYATDEYNGMTEYSGYLNVPDVEGSGDLMDNMNFALSDGTIRQIGWRPFGSLEDPVNTVPDTYLEPYSPDPTTDPTPTYTGSVMDEPYPNNNPRGTGRDVTINTIANVQYRVDGGGWIDATPDEGAFDEALEDFAFTTSTLEEGPHLIETRAINSIGNAETSYASDTVTISSPPDLGILPKFQHKDTMMLCLEGCALTGNHPWDDEHQSRGCLHDNWYCVRASIAMINSYYGGHISQDRISYYVMHERNHNTIPEKDLGHGRGLYPDETYDALSWTLYDASIDHHSGRPTFAQIKSWIDSGRPILRRDVSGDWHSTVIDGYENAGEKVHLIDPWTGTESSVAYSTLNVYEVWIPPPTATARSDESSLSSDTDGDGVIDFDENHRFGTDPNNPDTDGDLVPDKQEIVSYTFLTDESFDAGDLRKPDLDNDGLRCELDIDSDNGGTPDGLEDLNGNGRVDPDETDPLNPSDDPLHAASIRVIAQSPVNILITDPNNRRVGYDPVTHSVVNEIQGATYSGPGSEPQEIVIPNSLNGTYEVTAIGIDTGPYTITVESIDSNNSIIDSDTWQGMAVPDEQINENMRLDPDGRLILPHDIEVTNLLLDKTVVGQGYCVNATITVENQGDFTETFNVTVFYNETAISRMHTTITLTSGNSTTVTLTWNTTGIAKGNYTISAVADTVPEETDIDDNTLVVDEEICVSIPGDVDCDADVDLYDAVKLLVRYGAKEGSPSYDANCDIDGDGDIDLYDAVKLLTNYGKKVP